VWLQAVYYSCKEVKRSLVITAAKQSNIETFALYIENFRNSSIFWKPGDNLFYFISLLMWPVGGLDHPSLSKAEFKTRCSYTSIAFCVYIRSYNVAFIFYLYL